VSWLFGAVDASDPVFAADFAAIKVTLFWLPAAGSIPGSLSVWTLLPSLVVVEPLISIFPSPSLILLGFLELAVFFLF
jgi:hypothetical protein